MSSAVLNKIVSDILSTIDGEPDDRFLVASVVDMLDRQVNLYKLRKCAKLVRNEKMSEKDRMILRKVYLDCERAIKVLGNARSY